MLNRTADAWKVVLGWLGALQCLPINATAVSASTGAGVGAGASVGDAGAAVLPSDSNTPFDQLSPSMHVLTMARDIGSALLDQYRSAGTDAIQCNATNGRIHRIANTVRCILIQYLYCNKRAATQ